MPTDYSRDRAFIATLAGVQTIIERLSAAGVRDARALVDRQRGQHNLQGHAKRLIPLALWLARAQPDLLRQIRDRTSLARGMGKGSSESRDRQLWSRVQRAMTTSLGRHGTDVLTERDRANAPATAAEAALAYLPTDWGGSQVGGGGGATVIKRTLKLMSHTVIA